MRRRGWTIRTKTTVAFALASMASTTAVLVLVTLASLWTLSSVAIALDPASVTADATPRVEPEPGADPLPLTGDVPGQPDAHLVSPGGGDGLTTAFRSRLATVQWGWAAVGVLVSGVLAGGVGWVVSRRMLRPVDRISETARCLSASTLHERIGLDGPDDELRRLSRTIDDLLERLETAFESQRRFVAQASHELRTPLAVQRTALQVGLADGCDPEDLVAVRAELLEQNRRTEHLVESLLVLAEADRGLDGRTEAVDLGAVAEQTVAAARSAAARAGVVLRVADDRATPTADVVAEPVLVRQVLVNLVDNAVEYNRPGGVVSVVVDDEGVRVENDGPPVAAAAVAGLLEPFRRGDEPGSERHSGLGLSIVSAIARAHGWALEVRPRAGGGLVVVVRTAARGGAGDEGVRTA